MNQTMMPTLTLKLQALTGRFSMYVTNSNGAAPGPLNSMWMSDNGTIKISPDDLYYGAQYEVCVSSTDFELTQTKSF